MFRLLRKHTLVGLWGAALMLITADGGWTQEADILADGKREYQWYCAFCHGEDGKGDGPMTPNLVLKPSDLTQLQKQHGGEFPFWLVYRMIDGREEVKGHVRGAMPLWGQVFTRQEDTGGARQKESVARGRILSLIHYLESIQAKEH